MVFLNIFIFYYIYSLYLHTGVLCVCHSTSVEVRGKLWKSVVYFTHVGPNDQNQVIRIGDKCPSILNHLNHHRFISLGSAVMPLEAISIIHLKDQELQL